MHAVFKYFVFFGAFFVLRVRLGIETKLKVPLSQEALGIFFFFFFFWGGGGGGEVCGERERRGWNTGFF